jgi:integrase/recombinase XerD
VSNERRITYLEVGEVIKLVRSMSSVRDKLIVLLLYETGCSITELVNIKQKDIRTRSTEIVIENSVRTNEQRITQISKDLLNTIREYLLEKKKERSIPSNYLLSTRQSKSMTQKRIQQILSIYTFKTGTKTGEKITPQILRYTHIAHAYFNGVGIGEITRQVGLKRSRAIEIFSQLKSKTNGYDKFLDSGIASDQKYDSKIKKDNK